MILEGLVTTLSGEEIPNLAPMGPVVPEGTEEWRTFQLRPFRTSRTYANLKASREGVLHVSDDVLLLAQAALGPYPLPPTRPAEHVRGLVLTGACRYYEFRITGWDDQSDRAQLHAEVVHAQRLRDFFGFNRAKHAVLEAAILATRIAFLPLAQIEEEFDRLAIVVEKTGGSQERQAFALLRAHLEEPHG
jgi:hypothetical protein